MVHPFELVVLDRWKSKYNYSLSRRRHKKVFELDWVWLVPRVLVLPSLGNTQHVCIAYYVSRLMISMWAKSRPTSPLTTVGFVITIRHLQLSCLNSFNNPTVPLVKNQVVSSTPSIISNRRSVFTNSFKMSFVGHQSLISYSINWHPMIFGGWI